jgi:hypothetical protein
LLLAYLAASALWRAGWAVGPRYIAAAVGLLAVAAVPGVDALAARWPRAAPVALGALAALSVWHAGSSGALYPHQPEAFDNPVYDLNLRLVVLGLAPHTALEHLGVVGHAALVTLGLVALGALAPVAAGPAGGVGRRAATAALALGLAVTGAAGLATLGHASPAEERAWSLVARTWEPTGHSAPERRLAAFAALADPSAAAIRAAAQDAERLGRAEQARRLRERLERRERREREERARGSLPTDRLLLPGLAENPAWGAEGPD